MRETFDRDSFQANKQFQKNLKTRIFEKKLFRKICLPKLKSFLQIFRFKNFEKMFFTLVRI